MRKQTSTMQLQIMLATMLVTLSCTAQTNYNELTTARYHNITFNHVSLIDLLEFDGNINDLSSLFGISLTDVTHSNNDVGNDYDSPSIALSYFEDELASIKVKSSAIIVNIDGIDIRIGDNITQLALGYNGFNTFVDPSNNTERFALFKPMYDDSDVYIVYNASTGLIQEIGYFSPT